MIVGLSCTQSFLQSVDVNVSSSCGASHGLRRDSHVPTLQDYGQDSSAQHLLAPECHDLKHDHDNSGRCGSVFQIKLLWILCSFRVKDHKTGHHWKERSRTRTIMKIQEIKLTSKASHRHSESHSTDLLCNIQCGKLCTHFLPHHPGTTCQE